MGSIITLDNLMEFCLENKLFSYDASEHGDVMLIVHVPGNFENSISSKFSEEKPEGLLPVTLQACHIDLNRNGSFIAEDTMKAALPTFQNRPILAHIIQKDDGSYDFASHDMELVDDPWNEGEKRVHYIEQAIGIIPESCNAHLEYDKEKDKTYVVVNGYIYEDYGNGAAEILKEKESTKVSVELGVRKFSYNVEEKYLEIEDFTFLGLTALGEDVGEGMLGSNMKVNSFSNIHNEEKGGDSQMTLEDLLVKYNTKIEDLDFEVEGLDEVQLVEAFEKQFAETEGADSDEGADETDPGESEVETTEEPEDTGADDGDEEETEPPNEPEDEEEEDQEEEKHAASNDDEIALRRRQSSVVIGDHTYNFAASLDEIIYSLETLVNSTYSEADNAYYAVKVYDKYVVMVDYWTGKAYKQTYKVRNGSYSLTGDRVEVYARYLTKEEDQALDDMRSNYAAMESKLNHYIQEEEKTLKEDLLKSDDYKLIREEESFISLKDSINDYSLEELKSECDKLLLEFVKSGSTFASNNSQTDKRNKVNIGAKKEKTYSPYGTLFNDYK